MVFILSAGFAGWLAWYCMLTPPIEPSWVGPLRPCNVLVRESFCRYVLGFALVSSGIFLLAHFGCLKIRVIGSLFAVFAGFCGFVLWRRKAMYAALQKLPHDLAFGVLLTFFCICFGMFFRPYDAPIASVDASIYVATAHQLAKEGTIRHSDPLVAEMTPEERKVLFENRFKDDTTGPYARFPGGVPLIDPARDKVTFYFYHLFPVWLAFGLETLGGEGYMRLMSLFACVSLMSIFLIGKNLRDNLLGLSLCLVQLSFLPQIYYSSYPTSELLSQCLFLSGMYMFMNIGHKHESDNLPYVYICGLLWGALCLCKVECIPFLFCGITIISMLSDRGGLSLRDWLILIFFITLFSAIAICHQLSNAVYLQEFALVNTAIAQLIGSLFGERDLLGIIIITGMILVMIAILRSCRDKSICTLFYRSIKSLCIILSATFLVFFAIRFEWVRVVRHIHWITLYTTAYLLVLLAVGLAIVLFDGVLNLSSSNIKKLLAFFATPVFCYLIEPMVHPFQPWAIRRFVPMILPLFFILALYGWRAGLSRLCGKRGRMAQFIFLGMVCLTAGIFMRSSLLIVRQPLLSNVSPQLERLARSIPDKGLTIIPDSNAGLHIQAALRYQFGRDTLLLPLAGGCDKRFEEVMDRFLVRQIGKGKRVFLLVPLPLDPAGSLIQNFGLTFVSDVPFSFKILPWARVDTLSGGVEEVRLQNLLFEVHSMEHAAAPASIKVGDARQDLPVLLDGFYGPEVQGNGRTFRWTGPVARLVLPPVASINLLIDTRRPPKTEPASIRVELDGVPVEVIPEEKPGLLTIHVPAAGSKRDAAARTVTLTATTFNPKSLGISDDRRDLGVELLEVNLEPLPDANGGH